MIDFIPLNLYTDVFNYLVLFLVILAAVEGFTGSIFKSEVKTVNNAFGVIILVLLILYMGLRPISYHFGDTVNYANSFFRLQINAGQFQIVSDGEWIFNSLMLWFATYSNVHTFFLFCAFVYIGALWWALVRIFKDDFFIPLIVVISMFTFWSYGVNGIRNGMASSLIILAMTYRQKIPVAVILAVIALGIHKSMTLTVGAAVLAMFVKNPKLYLMGWFAAILVSLATGNLVADFFSNSGLIGDDRFAAYLNGEDYQDKFSRTGFRWDFLLYSAIPVAVGSYFIFKRKYNDKFYAWLFNIYLTTNAFWVLVIRANFSNRFAQISWFVMPLVLIYPFFMKKFWNDQETKIGWAVMIFYLYTFYNDILS